MGTHPPGRRFFFVPIAALTVGVVHGELTALLWGGAFGFVWAYTVVVGAVARFWARSPEGTVTGIPGALVFRTPRVPTAPALFAWSLVVEGRHSDRRRFQRSEPLDLQTTVTLDVPRGRYRTTLRWELTDVFGLTRGGPRTRWDTEVVVPPPPRPITPPRPPAVRRGSWYPRRTGRRAGDPFDVRRYHPGDDLRRIHWPLYAHSGVPFVRTADPSPPPTGRWHLVLDTEAETELDLDPRLEALAFWLGHLEAQDTPWILEIPSEGLTLGRGDPWSTVLASVSPAPLPGPAPGTNVGEVVVVTGPTGPGSGWTGALAVAVEAPRTATKPRRWWERR